MNTFLHDPDSYLDYTVDWSDWLADGETIVTSTWSGSSELTLGTQIDTTTASSIWLEMTGATVGMRYWLTNTITTNKLRRDQRTIILVCQER